MQTIKHGHYDEFTKWFDQRTREYPKFDINRVVDAREGADARETNLKSFVWRKQTTALNYAAFFGRFNIVDFLLKKGAGTYVLYVETQGSLGNSDT